VRDTTLIHMSNALHGNGTIVEIFGINPHRTRLTHDGWGSISELRCTKSSIMNTFQSNLTLEQLFIDKLDDWENIPDDVLWALKMN
jgi:hypothetical protein